MKIIIVCCTVILLISFNVKAQTTKNPQYLNQILLAYFNQTRLRAIWGIWADFQWRTKEDFINSFLLSILRVGVIFYIADNLKLTAGYAWVNYSPADNHKNISQTEHRLWRQFQWYAKYGRKGMVHWIRLEERFRHKILNDDVLADGYNFNYRIRYNWRYQLPLDKKANAPGATTFIINDEINVNAGKQIVYNYFDQNRLYAGLKIKLTAVSNLQFGYLNFFQQLAAGNQFKKVNALRLSYLQSIDLRHHS